MSCAAAGPKAASASRLKKFRSMLPKSRRIRSREYPRGPAEAAASSPAFKIKAWRGSNRAAVVVSKKVDARATVRNGLRRRINAVLEKKRFPGKDIVVFVSPEAKKIQTSELLADLDRLLSKLR